MSPLFRAARNIAKDVDYIGEMEMDMRGKLAIPAKAHELSSSSHPV